MFNLDAIKENPHLVTDYFLKIFENSLKLNLELFEKNLELFKARIYSVIKYSYLCPDRYIVLSSIFGAFLADSMGSATEFRTKSKDNHKDIYSEDGVFKPGQITDDSEMAISQAFAIMDTYNYKTLNQNLLFYYYGLWFASKPYDIGSTTRNALSMLDLTKINIDDPNIFSEKIKSKIASKNSASLANGFLMRASPLLCWFYMVKNKYVKKTLETKLPEKYLELFIKIRQEMSKDAQITHPNPELPIGGSLIIFMGLCAMQQKYSGQEIIEMTLLLLKNDYFINNEIEYKIKNSFEELVNEIAKPNFSKDDFFGNTFTQMGYYMHAFNLTVYYLSVFDRQRKTMSLKDIYNNMIFEISDFGGDTDTNGAIVGMVMGPLIGMGNFDRKYFDVFLNFYSRERILYNNIFMYLYAFYLEGIKDQDDINIENDIYKVKYGIIDAIIKLLNTELDEFI